MIIKIVPVSEQRKHLCIVLFKLNAFLNVLLERFSRPLAESSRFLGIDPVADCNNGTEVVMLCLIVFTVCGSYREFLGN